MKLILGVPASLGEFFWMLLDVGVVYFFSLVVARQLVRALDFSFRHPFSWFLPGDLVGSLPVVNALRRYRAAMELVVAHGVATIPVVYFSSYRYFQGFPLRGGSPYTFWFALRDSWYLQEDKLAHQAVQVDNLTREEQLKVKELTLELLYKSQTLITPVATPHPAWWGWIFFGLLVVLIFHRRGYRVMALVIPEVTTLPGALVLKLVYPVVVLGFLTWGVTRWWRSGLGVVPHGQVTLFPPGTTPTQAAARLDQLRWYTLVGGFGATGVTLVDWFLILSTLVSYRFPGLGASQLHADEPSLLRLAQDLGPPAAEEVHLFHVRYLELADRITHLEDTLAGYYPDGVDPVGELWWLPLVRLGFTLGLGVVVLVGWRARA